MTNNSFRNSLGLASLSALALAMVACCKPIIVPAPCPPPPILTPPPLRIHTLKPEATLGEMLTAALTDLAEQIGFRDRQAAALDAYRSPDPPKVVKKETPK
jgi:hypothetical protein